MTAQRTAHTAAAVQTLPQVLLPRDAANRLGISPSMLRKLTARGAIGYVRLGSGRKRQHIGYTEDQLAEFLFARTVPASDREPTQTAAAGRPVRSGRARRARSTSTVVAASDVIDQLVNQSLAAGTTDKWRP